MASSALRNRYHHRPQPPAGRSAINLGTAARKQRGVATLMVVMALFFIISLVAAYASRNLIFEQRTSANQYRSTQAFEAAEAGVDWALAMLNAGRVDANCVPTADSTFDSFRARYLTADPVTGGFAPVTWDSSGIGVALRASCVRDAAGWSCTCPSTGVAALTVPTGAGTFPAFRLRFELGTAPGLVRIVSVGCTAASDGCLNTGRGTAGDASSTVSALLALAPSMPTSPAAPLTVRGNLDVGAYPLHLANADAATNGITINAGGTVTAPNADLESVPGTPTGASIVDGDASLAGLTADRMFATFFGVARDTFKRQPSTVVVDCTGGCGTRLRDAVDRNPGRPVWINGDLDIDSDIVIGSADSPVLLVATGSINLSAPGARVVGIVYSQAADWASTGSGTIQGAAMAEGNLTGSTAPAIVFDPAVVNRVRLNYGPLIRAPGGWKDFS